MEQQTHKQPMNMLQLGDFLKKPWNKKNKGPVLTLLRTFLDSDAFNEEALLLSFIRHARYRASRSMQRYFYEVLTDLIPEEACKLDKPGVCGRPKGAYQGTYKERENSKMKSPRKETKRKEPRKKAAPTTAPYINLPPTTTLTTVASSPLILPSRNLIHFSSSYDTTTTQATSMASSSSSSYYSRSGDMPPAHFSPIRIGHPTANTTQPLFIDLEKEMSSSSSKGSKRKLSDNDEGEEYYPALPKKARIECTSLVVVEEEDLLDDPLLQAFAEEWEFDGEVVVMEWMELAQAIVMDPVVAKAVRMTSVEDVEFGEGFDDIYWEE